VKRVVVVREGLPVADALLGLLTAAGFEATAVTTAAEARTQVLGTAVAVVLSWADAQDAQRHAAVLAMAPGLRRGCVVALLGPGLASGDGVRAFQHSADLVVAPGDAQRLGEMLGATLAAKRTLVAILDPAAATRLGG
jgi:hypothetical protein